MSDPLDIFFDEIKAEEVDKCGYVDLDAIENIYLTLKADDRLKQSRSHTSAPAAEAQQRIEQAIKELEEAKLSFTWPTSEKHIDKAIALLRGEEKP